MQVEIWSDVVCPWCYVGKRRFEVALERFEHRDEVDVTYRSFELDPSAPRQRHGTVIEHVAKKYRLTMEQAKANMARLEAAGEELGIDFRFDLARGGNTLDAHRLLHLADRYGLGAVAKERFLRAYFVEGEPIGEPETLVRIIGETGIPATEARAVLDGDDFVKDVRADETAAQAMGISAVPCFVFDRVYGIPGAQDPDVLLTGLRRMWARQERLAAESPPPGSPAPADTPAAACDGDSCAL